MHPIFFASQKEFRNWLEKNHEKESEILVGYYKVSTGKPSMTWSQSVDVALCFGWIDGVRTSIDAERYQIRFTPRKSGSIWSDVNIKKIEMLKELGLMLPAGLAQFELRKESKSRIYAYENETTVLHPDFIQLFKENKTAWNYFEALAPSYKKLSIHWVMNAKQESTRMKRLQELISDCQLLQNKWKDNNYMKKK
jgi:uncharacterized protein YdeI (YjbR/CyaY-like superfamily)